MTKKGTSNPLRGFAFALLAGTAAVLGLAPTTGLAYQETQQVFQPEARDASGALTVEASNIHVIACNGPGENGGQFYIYQYLNRPGFRAILPPNWGNALGGRDFATFQEAATVACGGMQQQPFPPADQASAVTAQSCEGGTGTQCTYGCPPGMALGTRLWGTGIYTDDSHVCTAAVHAGAISQAGGGWVTITIADGQASYASSTQNGLTSSAYGGWGRSFTIAGAR